MKGGRRIALVTGAARGIGAAITDRLLADGLTVLAADLPGAPRPPARPDRVDIDLDVAAPPSRLAVLEHLDRLDVLVNNAGVFHRSPLADSASLARNARMFRVNSDAPAAMIELCTPMLREGRSPAIVNVASVRGLTAAASACAYSVSKAVVIDVTARFAGRLAPAIRVNAVAPGDIETEMSPTEPAILERLLSRIPLGRFGRPDEVAGAVAFLASPRALAVNGAILAVDGGFLCT